jgi:hypothetical protein
VPLMTHWLSAHETCPDNRPLLADVEKFGAADIALMEIIEGKNGLRDARVHCTHSSDGKKPQAASALAKHLGANGARVHGPRRKWMLTAFPALVKAHAELDRAALIPLLL